MVRSNIRRFTPVQMLFHGALIVTFMLLSITGLAWMFIETAWGQSLAAPFGGYTGALEVHKITGLILLGLFAIHIFYTLYHVDWKRPSRTLRGPDSLVFQWRDVKDFFRHLGWILGLSEEPQFDRWSWWEKFDYWAVWWGFMIVGVTGLMLYNPVLTSQYLPGWLLNVALWMHRIEAVLAMAHIFTIHFFIEHFRPRNFPFSATMFEGSKDIDHLREEHPAWIARLEAEGRLEALRVNPAPVPLRILYFGVGYALIGLGVLLLVFGLINVTLLTLELF
ncbi:MAG: cytochrome b/b6 domain-containing protein [Chromatiaceae bacterium]|nr:cytochrome b/b6 domain-containing protein [Candidatus Thioaporhodococcus sediminis]